MRTTVAEDIRNLIELLACQHGIEAFIVVRFDHIDVPLAGGLRVAARPTGSSVCTVEMTCGMNATEREFRFMRDDDASVVRDYLRRVLSAGTWIGVPPPQPREMRWLPIEWGKPWQGYATMAA